MSATLHATIPNDWLPYSARDVVVIARPPSDTGWFCTNVLIGRDEVPTGLPLAALLAATNGSLEALGDDVEVVGDRYFANDGLERASRLVCFDLVGAPGRVAQLQCFVAPLGTERATRTVAQFAGTCAFEELDRHGPAFVRMIESIDICETLSDGRVRRSM